MSISKIVNTFNISRKFPDSFLESFRQKIYGSFAALDINLKFATSDFGKPGFFSRGEINESLNLDGKVACVKERFSKCEMRMEKVSVHDFRSDIGM